MIGEAGKCQAAWAKRGKNCDSRRVDENHVEFQQ